MKKILPILIIVTQCIYANNWHKLKQEILFLQKRLPIKYLGMILGFYFAKKFF